MSTWSETLLPPLCFIPQIAATLVISWFPCRVLQSLRHQQRHGWGPRSWNGKHACGHKNKVQYKNHFSYHVMDCKGRTNFILSRERLCSTSITCYNRSQYRHHHSWWEAGKQPPLLFGKLQELFVVIQCNHLHSNIAWHNTDTLPWTASISWLRHQAEIKRRICI